MPLPAVLTVMEGGVEPRYPSIPGRMKAKKITIDQVTPTLETVGSGRIRLKLPEAQPNEVDDPGRGPRGSRRRRRRHREAGSAEVTGRVLVLVETDEQGAIEVSQETLTFARGLRR